MLWCKFKCLSLIILFAISSSSWARDYTVHNKAQILQNLTATQYNVTQKNSTERAFVNEFWDNRQAGIYVDIVSGEPLFISTDKYKSGTGWPSFTKPLVAGNIRYVVDKSWFTTRIEVRSKYGDSHLGHVFNDGPPTTNKRYCINSAALRFIPVAKLQQAGYSKYLALFNKHK